MDKRRRFGWGLFALIVAGCQGMGVASAGTQASQWLAMPH